MYCPVEFVAQSLSYLGLIDSSFFLNNNIINSNNKNNNHTNTHDNDTFFPYQDDYFYYNNTTNFIYYDGFGTSDICDPFIIYLQYLYTYYIPVIVFVGLVGNFLSCIVFSTTPLRAKSSSYYLAALSLADLGFVCMVMVVNLNYNGVSTIFNQNGWCQVFVYVSSVSAAVSVWLVVAFTVERYIAIKYPFQRPQICTVRRAKVVVIIIVVVSLTAHSYIFVTSGILETQSCELKPEYESMMVIVNFIDTVVTLVIPFFVIVILNTLMARSLRIKNGIIRRNLRNQAPNGEEAVNLEDMTNGNSSSSNSRESRFRTVSEGDQPSGSSGRPTRVRTSCIAPRKPQEKVTKMLLIISTVFIVLNFPSYIVRMTLFFAYTLPKKIAPTELWCIQQFSMLLYYTNFSINFVLYSLCGASFRCYLLQLLKNFSKKIMFWKKRRNQRNQNLD